MPVGDETLCAILFSKLCRLNYYKQFAKLLVDYHLKDSKFDYSNIVILIGLSHAKKLEADQKLESAFMKGVQGYLSSTSVIKRTRGMVVGELLMSKLRPEMPLNFDVDETDEVRMLRKLAKGESAGEPSSKSNTNSSVSVPQTKTEVVDESEDEEELAPLPNPDSRINSKKPIYLRDCMANLRIEDPDVQDLALKTLPNLITMADTSDLADVFDTLCQQLLLLQNPYDMADFDLFVQESMVCLGVRLPKLTAKALNEALVSDEKSLMSRLAILRWMTFIVAVGTKRGSLAQENTSALVKKSTEKVAFANSFPDFFFPLIDNFPYINSLHSSTGLSHNALLDSYLKTTALILKCAENSIHSLRMAHDLFEILPTIEYLQQDGNARNSILLAFNIILSVVPPALFADEMGGREAINRAVWFLQGAIKGENDEERVERAESLCERLKVMA
ncbi:hypothetical protein BCR33DRAFT_735454 [Rhizoclosmatium globosum]|uniref:Telomere length regulation protein conserved domain-containing protein n=1 Tax=Rhizoclosmatium globosum TaxID=329046 RepID=A0A1Y2CNL7_9FUNG|nr:hypothetical protein BCR33DRAFT_735454 [Rhizoclosmatium globosum]|eukprot:ORY48611.1 hypothetical protein BCR33DRAFT_735454 [Rhizoclosmatium globosum]